MKINFVYHTPKSLGSGYMGSEGLKQALDNNGLLNYSYNQTGDKILDIPKYQESPIFMVRGFLNARMPLVARAGNQFIAAWQSESYYTRHGEKDSSTDVCVANQSHFNMYFTCAETDLDMYDIPTYWLPSWADITVLDERGSPELPGLGFIGGREGREDFLNQDTKGIINHQRTKLDINNAVSTATRLSELISKFDMLVSPPGRCYNGMCGRAFEIMACNRLCFQYLNEDTMFDHMAFFTDGVDLVYFKTYDELVSKYQYYQENLPEANEIAWNGYNKVREFHNQDIRVKYIVECMGVEHAKWVKDQKNVPGWMGEVERVLS